MNFFIFIGLSLIYQISAIEINDQKYKSVKGIKANLNVTRVTKARSAVQCASHCSNAEGCVRANFHGSTCEFLDFVPGNGEIEFVEEQDSKYIYSESCNTLECQNGGRCASTESGIQCNCPFGFVCLLCQKECTLVYNDRCYVLVLEWLSWYDARNNCTREGGRLAEVCEPGLNDMLLQIETENAFWLGGSDERNEGQWEWATGNCDWQWADWGPRYDSLSDQNCLIVRSDFKDLSNQ